MVRLQLYSCHSDSGHDRTAVWRWMAEIWYPGMKAILALKCYLLTGSRERDVRCRLRSRQTCGETRASWSPAGHVWVRRPLYEGSCRPDHLGLVAPQHFVWPPVHSGMLAGHHYFIFYTSPRHYIRAGAGAPTTQAEAWSGPWSTCSICCYNNNYYYNISPSTQ